MKTIEKIDIKKVCGYYKYIENIVNNNKMVCNSTSITESLEEIDNLVENIRNIKEKIGFGSISSAVTHLLKHPVDPLQSFLQSARNVIATGEAKVIINQDYIEIQFYLQCNGKWAKCCVYVFKTTKRVILTTFMPNNNKK
jgi:hypothetical protein